MLVPQELLLSVKPDPRWNNSPFRNFTAMAIATRGVRYEKLFREIAENEMHLKWSPRLKGKGKANRDYDCFIEGQKAEIKGASAGRASTGTATGDDKKNHFAFNQIRPDQDYEILILMAMHFSGNIDLFRIPKADVAKMIEQGLIPGQHGGKKAKETRACTQSLESLAKYHWHRVHIDNKVRNEKAH